MFKLFGAVYLCLSLAFFLSCPRLNEWVKGIVYKNCNTHWAAESFSTLGCPRFGEKPTLLLTLDFVKSLPYLGWSCSSVQVQFSCSVFFSSWQPHGLWPTRLLCPWYSPSKNTEVGCHALHQEIFPTQGSNPGLLHHLHLQVGSLPLAPPAAKLRENQKNVSCLCTGEVFSFSLKQGGK